MQRGAKREATTTLKTIDEDDRESIEETPDSDEELQVERSESEQWQEVISRREKQNLKNASHASLLTWKTVRIRDERNSLM